VSAPRVYALPPGADFAAAFARGYHHRVAGLSPMLRGRALVLVNTTRALRDLTDALADQAEGQGLLPRLMLIPDLADSPLAPADLAPGIAPLRRRLRLTRLVESFLTAKHRAGERMAPIGAAAELAAELELLIDQFHDQGIALDRLDTAPDGLGLPADAARHWQQTLAFVDIVRRNWPAIRAADEHGGLDPRDRQRQMIEALIARWKAAPPDHPVIVAGSTGSVASTAELMAAVAGLPRGSVVLPGFDPAIEPEIWANAGPDHPTGPFRGFLEAARISPADVQPWEQASVPTSRQQLLAQALRPAPVTDHWHQHAPALYESAGAALANIGLMEAESPRLEAAAIALAIREALEDPTTRIALITPDGEIARRVTTELERFDIVPDDTVGQPLAQSVPGVLMRLILDAADGTVDQVGIAALLQHPLVATGIERGQHRRLARIYEREVLRGHVVLPGGGLPPPSLGDDNELTCWIDGVDAALRPLAEAIAGPAALDVLVAAHARAAEVLTDPADGAGPAIWHGDAGEALHRFIDRLATNADALGGGPVADYPALLAGLMRGETLRPKPRQPHPRVRISGTREARFEAAGLVIAAGLNDGTWPEAPDPGPWLNRPMIGALGLPPPERAVGLSAHDFVQAASRPRVLLTRSGRIDGSPTVPSRWLVRLETLLTGIGAEEAWRAARDTGGRYLRLAAGLGRPTEDVPRAPRPRPRPPREAIPARLSVTQLETLIRDAYAVYARHILGLKALEPLARQPDARERGTVLHEVLENFIDRTKNWPGTEPAAILLEEVADEVLALHPLPADLRRAWRARIKRFADWFVEGEDERRQHGAPVARERFGKMQLDLPGGPFTVSAKADRIDRRADGTGAVYDYKTGAPPTNPEIDAGFNHQLHLQGAILADGGFADVPAMTPASGAYIGLTGSGDGGKITEREDLASEIARHVEYLKELITAYREGAPWTSRGRPQRTSWESDYDHLARVREWEGEDDP